MRDPDNRHYSVGHFMQMEMQQCSATFNRAITQTVSVPKALTQVSAFYTVARGSSDAAANILSYEFMQELSVPVTSLPPSVFSLGAGINLKNSAVLVVSQSGASEDLIQTAKGSAERGAIVVGITNQSPSAVGSIASVALDVLAGTEKAVPATKSVVGSIAAGLALLAAIKPAYADKLANECSTLMPKARFLSPVVTTPDQADAVEPTHPQSVQLTAALVRAQHVYVVGRGAGLGACQEVALKLKETSILHAEAYSASEVLHGPLQLVGNPLTVIMLDTEEPRTQSSMDIAETRFRNAGSTVFRIRVTDTHHHQYTPASAAAALLSVMYPIVYKLALTKGFDPDSPIHLAKVTKTI